MHLRMKRQCLDTLPQDLRNYKLCVSAVNRKTAETQRRKGRNEKTFWIQI